MNNKNPAKYMCELNSFGVVEGLKTNNSQRVDFRNHANKPMHVFNSGICHEIIF